MHEHLGAVWPCSLCDEFDRVWGEIREVFRSHGLRFGAGAYGGWDDGDEPLARALYGIVRHRRPRTVVETGVGRGVSSRVMLEAMAKNGAGHLSSIDLPPLLERDLELQTGVAVSDRLRPRWTLLHGSSRRRLPALVRALGEIDLFVHDSFHSARNLLFEWEIVLPRLVPNGLLVADDVERHRGVSSFRSDHEVRFALVGAHADGPARFAVVAPAA